MLKFCYCIVDRSSVAYLDMAALSVAFLRQTQPLCRVEIVTDTVTRDFAQARKHMLLGMCDEWIAVDCSNWSVVQASRYLKVNLRQLVQGTYVFLDADVLPIAPWEPRLRPQTSLALATDVWSGGKVVTPPERLLVEFGELGWQVPPLYYNSGVMFMKDDDFTHKISQEWFERWKVYLEKIERAMDQPSLNSTFVVTPEFEQHFERLPSRFNALITAVHDDLKNAAFLHFLSDEDKTVHLDMVARHSEGRLSSQEIEAFTRHPYPWKKPGRISAHWHAREYSLALRYALLKARARSARAH
jgi:hypothetical protein